MSKVRKKDIEAAATIWADEEGGLFLCTGMRAILVARGESELKGGRESKKGGRQAGTETGTEKKCEGASDQCRILGLAWCCGGVLIISRSGWFWGA